MSDVNYITDQVKALIGMTAERVPALHTIEPSEVRRFYQATMDEAPRYWDQAWAEGSRYGGLVAPPAFPVHSYRRAPNTPDPLAAMEEKDFDGLSRTLRPGLPSVPVSLVRLLNGGYQYEFYRYAHLGERVYRTSRYKDIYQKESKNGPMVFIHIEDLYTNEQGEKLIAATTTTILR